MAQTLQLLFPQSTKAGLEAQLTQLLRHGLTAGSPSLGADGRLRPSPGGDGVSKRLSPNAGADGCSRRRSSSPGAGGCSRRPLPQSSSSYKAAEDHTPAFQATGDVPAFEITGDVAVTVSPGLLSSEKGGSTMNEHMAPAQTGAPSSMLLSTGAQHRDPAHGDPAGTWGPSRHTAGTWPIDPAGTGDPAGTRVHNACLISGNAASWAASDRPALHHSPASVLDIIAAELSHVHSRHGCVGDTTLTADECACALLAAVCALCCHVSVSQAVSCSEQARVGVRLRVGVLLTGA